MMADPEEEKAFWVERRRLLLSEVALIERRYRIEPVCRVCAGCENCERLHRHQNDVRYTLRDRTKAPNRAPVN